MNKIMNKKSMMIVALLLLQSSLFVLSTVAQPTARRKEQQQQAAEQKSNANNMTTRAQISFPTAVNMSEDVVWRRDIYRELNLTEAANSPLYYPVEPAGDQQNLFTYIFKLMLTGKIKVYEYRIDGNEVFNDSARVKPLDFLDSYGIYYERNGKALHIDNSDIPSKDVTSYYIKESAYYDQANATFHKKVLALCPIMKRVDDFGDGGTPYPLFWVKYEDLAPFLAKHTLMTSDLNNAATMSADDYFTKNQYKGKIYKTTNMLGRFLANYCPDEESMTAEQKRIEAEITAFETSLYKTKEAPKDSADSVQVDAKKSAKKAKTSKTSARTKTSTKSTVKKEKKSSSPAPSSSTARVTARRQRH